MEIKTKRGVTVVDTDEHPIRGASLESMAKLPPAFIKDGVVTAANASGINDAAAAVVVMSREKADALGIPPWPGCCTSAARAWRPRGHGTGSGGGHSQMSESSRYDCGRCGLLGDQRGFCRPVYRRGAQGLEQDFGIRLDRGKVNVNGSGISLGHPVGCTALRIIVTLLYEMKRAGHKIGCASLCVGGGPSMAAIVEAL